MVKNGGGMWPQYGAPGSRRPRRTCGAAKFSHCRSFRRPDQRRQRLPLLSMRQPFFRVSKRLTEKPVKAYIGPLGCAAAWRDGASAKPLTVHTVTEHPAMNPWPCSRRRVGCVGFRLLRQGLSGFCLETELQGSGCLTSESEERETRTAESLRAASSNGEGFGFFLQRTARKRLRRSTFQVNTLDSCEAHRFAGALAQLTLRGKLKWDLVKRCDQPGKVLIQLESLILAQSERWRQA